MRRLPAFWKKMVSRLLPSGARADAAERCVAYLLTEYLATATGRGRVVDIGRRHPRYLAALQAPAKLALLEPDQVHAAKTRDRRIVALSWDAPAALPRAVVAEAAATVALCADLASEGPPADQRLDSLVPLVDAGAIVIVTATAPNASAAGPPLVEWRERMQCAGMRATFAGTFGDRGTIVSIHDRNISEALASPAGIERPLIISAAYNDADIIEATVADWLRQGCDVHLIENWSADDTYAILQSLQRSAPGRIALERFPTAGATGQFQLREMLQRKSEIAAKFPGRWIVHADSDEIRESPWRDVSLRQAFAVAQAAGYNACDFTVFNFFPTQDGFVRGDDPKTFFDRCEPEGGEIHDQLKAWKQPAVPVDLAWRGGHTVRFPGLRAFPYRFLNRHYRIRSNGQARAKIKDRLPRFTSERERFGWHIHYDAMRDRSDFIREPQTLRRFAGVDAIDGFLVEAVSDFVARRRHPHWATMLPR